MRQAHSLQLFSVSFLETTRSCPKFGAIPVHSMLGIIIIVGSPPQKRGQQPLYPRKNPVQALHKRARRLSPRSTANALTKALDQAVLSTASVNQCQKIFVFLWSSQLIPVQVQFIFKLNNGEHVSIVDDDDHWTIVMNLAEQIVPA